MGLVVEGVVGDRYLQANQWQIKIDERREMNAGMGGIGMTTYRALLLLMGGHLARTSMIHRHLTWRQWRHPQLRKSRNGHPQRYTEDLWLDLGSNLVS